MNEDKHEKFRRLAKLRGERVLKDLQLIGNLSNRRNYEYNENDLKALFGVIEEELKVAKASFMRGKKRGIKLWATSSGISLLRDTVMRTV